MTNEQTPREFFIAYSKYTNAYEVLEKEIKVGQRFYDSYSSAYVNCDELIKTVEYSAYEEVKEQNEKLIKMIEVLNDENKLHIKLLEKVNDWAIAGNIENYSQLCDDLEKIQEDEK